MKQAIVIKNPKWEPFTKASDAFKKLNLADGESAVLVVRGRAKEVRPGKAPSKLIKSQPETPAALAADLRKTGATEEQIKKAVAAFKPLSKASAIVALLLALCLPAFSQANLVNNLATATLAGATTNATAGQGFIGWNIDQVAVLQLSVVGTNAATTGTVTVLLDTSDNGSDWLAAQYTTATVTCNGTTTATGISRITNSVGGKYLRIGGYKSTNASTNAVTVPSFTISLKGS